MVSRRSRVNILSSYKQCDKSIIRVYVNNLRISHLQVISLSFLSVSMTNLIDFIVTKIHNSLCIYTNTTTELGNVTFYHCKCSVSQRGVSDSVTESSLISKPADAQNVSYLGLCGRYICPKRSA